MMRLLRPPLLSRSQVLGLYQPRAGDGCVLWLPGQDDAYSAVIKDRSGYGNHGTLASPTWKQNSKGIWYPDFDGADDTITVPKGASINDLTTITILAWIYPETTGENSAGRIFDKHGAKGFYVNSESATLAFTFFHTRATTSGNWDSPDNTIVLNKWQHVAVTYDNTSTANNPLLYYMGLPVAVTETSVPDGAADADNPDDLFIGNRNGLARAFDGGIIVVSYFNTIFPATTIKDIVNQERHLFGV